MRVIKNECTCDRAAADGGGTCKKCDLEAYSERKKKPMMEDNGGQRIVDMEMVSILILLLFLFVGALVVFYYGDSFAVTFKSPSNAINTKYKIISCSCPFLKPPDELTHRGRQLEVNINESMFQSSISYS